MTSRFVVSPRRAPHIRVTVSIDPDLEESPGAPYVRVYSARSGKARIYAPTRAPGGRVRWRHVFTQGGPHAAR